MPAMTYSRATALALLAALAAAPAHADPLDGCRQNQDLEQKVESCTGLLVVLDGVIGDHAWALAERANGHCWLGGSEAAVVDIWHWFSEDPASIRRMQAKLATLGFYAGEINGGFSAALDDAVIAWAEAGCPEAR